MMRRNERTLGCAHLLGKPGNTVECSVYSDRPSVCRRFEAGSDKCLEFRRIYGLEARLTDDEAAQAIAKFRDRPRARNVIVEAAVVEDHGIFGWILARLGIAPNRPKLKLVGYFDDDTKMILHKFWADETDIFESEFWGLTIDQARELIAGRTKPKVREKGTADTPSQLDR